MDKLEAIKNRHSVRDYSEKEIEESKISKLQKEIDEINKSSGLSIKLVTNEPKAFGGLMAHYGKFKGVKNYIALIGKKSDNLDEKCGYYGEQLVISAQMLGLNTCWVALTVSKSRIKPLLEKGEKLVCVIALGYGNTQGVAHKSKSMEKLCKTSGKMPEWFKNGMESAMLAPTAMNQQQFLIELKEDESVQFHKLSGFYSKVDIGIVRYNFEVGANKK